LSKQTCSKGVIKKIALALGDLNGQIIFVGGAVVGLYINDPAADDVRPTKDVDISLSIASLVELENIRVTLIDKGFIQTAEDTIICRFRYDDVKVDVMNTKALGWASANPWFSSGFQNKLGIQIENQKIFILPLPYYIASKFAAYSNRGNKEPRTSHDFEDIVYVVDNRIDFVEQILSASNDVRPFLKNEFAHILNDKVKQEAIYGNLFYETKDQRYAMIIEKLKAIVSNPK
jgi:predicted nucleotidyltransferase